MKVTYLYEGSPFGKLNKNTNISKLSIINDNISKNIIAEKIYKPLFEFLIDLNHHFLNELNLDFTGLNVLNDSSEIDVLFEKLNKNEYLNFLKHYFDPWFNEMKQTGILKIPCLSKYNIDDSNTIINEFIHNLLTTEEYKLEKIILFITDKIKSILNDANLDEYISSKDIHNIKIVIIPAFVGGVVDNKIVSKNIQFYNEQNDINLLRLISHFNTNIRYGNNDYNSYGISIFNIDKTTNFNTIYNSLMRLDENIDISAFFSYITVNTGGVNSNYSNYFIFDQMQSVINIINLFKRKNSEIVGKRIWIRCSINYYDFDKNNDIISNLKKSLNDLPFIKDKISKMFDSNNLDAAVNILSSSTNDKNKQNIQIVPYANILFGKSMEHIIGKILLFGYSKVIPSKFKNAYMAYQEGNDDTVGNETIMNNWIQYYNELNIPIPTTLSKINEFFTYLKTHGNHNIYLVDDNDINNFVSEIKNGFDKQMYNLFTDKTLNVISNKLGLHIKIFLDKLKIQNPNAVTSDNKLIITDYGQTYTRDFKNFYLSQSCNNPLPSMFVNLDKKTITFNFEFKIRIGFKDPTKKIKLKHKIINLTFKLDEL